MKQFSLPLATGAIAAVMGGTFTVSALSAFSDEVAGTFQESDLAVYAVRAGMRLAGGFVAWWIQRRDWL